MSTQEYKRILLVEDQLIIGMRQKLELEQKGYLVAHVSSSETAIEATLKDEEKFDLILMDIDLGPGADGIETAQQIITKKDIPVLFLSSHTALEIVAKTEEVTSYGYVTKNSGITVLDASIKMAFKLHKARKHESAARKGAEKALTVSENAMHKLIAHMLEGFLLVEAILDPSGCVIDIRYLEVNHGAEKITGLRKIDFIGKTAQELFNNKVESIFFEKHDQVLKSGEPIQFIEFFSELKQWYELSIYKVEDQKLAIFFHDITNQIKAEEVLKANESKYRNVFEHMSQEVHFWKLVRDEAGEIKTWQLIDANPAALKGWNKSRDSVVGKIAEEVFQGSDPTEQFMPIVKKIFEEGKPHSWEMFFEAANQHLFMTSVPFGEYFVSTGIDITDNILLKQQVKEKETLVKEILHRVKNNFSSLIAMLYLQAEAITSQEALGAIHEATSRIEAMSKIYGKLLISDEHNKIRIRNYVEELGNSIVDLMGNSGTIKLDLNIEDLILEESKIFPLGAIINELITNSIKHGFKDIEYGSISIKLTKIGNEITLIYHDNGHGLPEKFNENKAGLGLMLITLFSQQLKTTYQLYNDNGVKCVMSFKL